MSKRKVWGQPNSINVQKDTHQWTVGDIVHWDNQAVLHARTAFDGRRVLKRISFSGSRPF